MKWVSAVLVVVVCHSRAHGVHGIEGGKSVQPQKYKWFGSLFVDTSDSQFRCGSVLVAPEWALTAAHCVSKVNAGAWIMFEGAGTQVGGRWMPPPSRIVKETYSDPRYLPLDPGFDVALLRLNAPLNVPCPAMALSPGHWGSLPSGSPVSILGRGRDGSGGWNTNLTMVSLAKVTTTRCTGSTRDRWPANEIMGDLCAGGWASGGRSPCPGACGVTTACGEKLASSEQIVV